MSDVFYFRPMDPPIVPSDLDAMIAGAGDCFNLHRVTWRRSFLTREGDRMLCWYHAPDSESVRIAMRTLGADLEAVLPGRAVSSHDEGNLVDEQATLLVDISVDAQSSRDAVDAALAECRADNPTSLQAIELNQGTRFYWFIAGMTTARVAEILNAHHLASAQCYEGQAINPPIAGR